MEETVADDGKNDVDDENQAILNLGHAVGGQ
jgi:hypothetical protein